MDDQLQRIMLVEDEPDIRTVAGMALEMVGGFSVCLCASGVQALGAIADFRPQVILLDVMMPDMDGPGVLGKLRSDPQTALIPVIFLTAKAQPEEIDKLRGLGAIAVLAKPFDPMTLAESVKTAWQNWRG